MAKAISGDAFIPANRENPSLRMSAATRSKWSNSPRPGDRGRAVKTSRVASERAGFEYPKNTVNIHKFLKITEKTMNLYYVLFHIFTRYISSKKLVFCRNLSNKKSFLEARISPHLLREAHRVVRRRVERGRIAQIERRRQPHARRRGADPRRPVPGAEVEALISPPADKGQVVRRGGPEAAPGLLDGAGGDSGRDPDALAQQPGHPAHGEPRVLAGELSRRAQQNAAVGAGHEVGVVHGQHDALEPERSGVHGEHLPALGGDGRSRDGARHAAAADACANEDGGRFVDARIRADAGDFIAFAQDFLGRASGDDLHPRPPAGELERGPQFSDFEVSACDQERSRQFIREAGLFVP